MNVVSLSAQFVTILTGALDVTGEKHHGPTEIKIVDDKRATVVNHCVRAFEQFDIVARLQLRILHLAPPLIIIVGALLAPVGVAIELGEQSGMGLEGYLHAVTIVVGQPEHRFAEIEEVGLRERRAVVGQRAVGSPDDALQPVSLVVPRVGGERTGVEVGIGIAHNHHVAASVAHKTAGIGQHIAVRIVEPPRNVGHHLIKEEGLTGLQGPIGVVGQQAVGEVEKLVPWMEHAVIGLRIADNVGIQLATDVNGGGIVLNVPVDIRHSATVEIAAHHPNVAQTLLVAVIHRRREDYLHAEAGVGPQQVVESLILPHRNADHDEYHAYLAAPLQVPDIALLPQRCQPIAYAIEPSLFYFLPEQCQATDSSFLCHRPIVICIY